MINSHCTHPITSRITGSDICSECLPDSRSVVEDLIEDVYAGIMVLALRDGLPVTPALAMERARNVTAALVGLYDITRKVER